MYARAGGSVVQRRCRQISTTRAPNACDATCNYVVGQAETGCQEVPGHKSRALFCRYFLERLDEKLPEGLDGLDESALAGGVRRA